jgi:hypothetical protein
METTDEQKQLLAALVEQYPDEGNSILTRAKIVAHLSIQLHWDREKTGRVYDELKAAGAVQNIGGMEFITPDGAMIGTKELQESHFLGVRATELREQKQKRREVMLMIVGGIIGFASALGAVYIAHRMGWNQ